MERQGRLMLGAALLLLMFGRLAGLQTAAGTWRPQAVVAQKSAPDTSTDTPVAVTVGSVTTEVEGVQIIVMPRIGGAPFTAFTVVVPVTYSGGIGVAIAPSPGELALAGGDPSNLQVVNTLTNATVTCVAAEPGLRCLLDGPGRFELLVSPSIPSGRGPAPILVFPQPGAGVVSVGPTATPESQALRPAAAAPISIAPQQGAGVVSVGPTATPTATPTPEPAAP